MEHVEQRPRYESPTLVKQAQISDVTGTDAPTDSYIWTPKHTRIMGIRPSSPEHVD